MGNLYEAICKEIEKSPKNIKFVEKFEQRFKDAGLFDELIKLYQMSLVQNEDVSYFEKIADLYNECGNYEEAINYYLNYCESTEATPEIYYKLAEVFEKNNDIQSTTSCLEFAKKLEEKHGN